MSVFKRNLTSIMLTESLVDFAGSRQDEELWSIVEIGCGDANISRHALLSGKKFNLVYGIDISDEAIKAARDSFKNCSICGNMEYDFIQGTNIADLPITNLTMPIFLVDVAAISEDIARMSDWYTDVPCETGRLGTKLILNYLEQILQLIEIRQFQKYTIIMPIIGLADFDGLERFIVENFSEVKTISNKEWPLPDNLIDQIDAYKEDLTFCSISRKFGKSYTFTKILRIGE